MPPSNYAPVLCKSMNWFLYDRDLRHEEVKSEMIYNKIKTVLLLIYKTDTITNQFNRAKKVFKVAKVVTTKKLMGQNRSAELTNFFSLKNIYLWPYLGVAEILNVSLKKKLEIKDFYCINALKHFHAFIHSSMVYSGLNIIFSRKYIVFLSTFQNVLFYYQDIKLTLKKTTS